MSEESEMYYIPRKLDDPERILFFSTDEVMVMMFPFMMMYLMLDSLLLGLICGAFALYSWKKFKGSEQANLHVYIMYWFYPGGLLKLKATPPSYIRKYYG